MEVDVVSLGAALPEKSLTEAALFHKENEGELGDRWRDLLEEFKGAERAHSAQSRQIHGLGIFWWRSLCLFRWETLEGNLHFSL